MLSCPRGRPPRSTVHCLCRNWLSPKYLAFTSTGEDPPGKPTVQPATPSTSAIELDPARAHYVPGREGKDHVAGRCEGRRRLGSDGRGEGDGLSRHHGAGGRRTDHRRAQVPGWPTRRVIRRRQRRPPAHRPPRRPGRAADPLRPPSSGQYAPWRPSATKGVCIRMRRSHASDQDRT